MRFDRVVVLAGLVASTVAQGPPHNGPRPVDPCRFALTDARVVPEPGKLLDGATVLIVDGRIAAVGSGFDTKGAVPIDCSGLTIYAGLVEPFYPSDVPALDPKTTDQHWSPMVQAERSALDGALVGEADRTALRALGYTTVAAVPSGGILKGTSAVVLLDEPTETDKPRVVQPAAYAAASLQTDRSGYPNSEMGAIALLRQSLFDGQWYERCQRAAAADPALATAAPQPSRALAAIAAQWRLPLWFDTDNELQALRAVAIAREFERAVVLVGSGMEFRRLAALATAKAPLVVPLQLPDPPDVSTAAAAERVTLRQLQSWEQAPTNTKRLLDAGLTVAWTTHRLRDRKDLPARVRDAMQQGVTAEQALAAVTTVPAALLGIADRVGTIAEGSFANLVVVDGELFADGALVRDVWVGGVRHVIAPAKDRGLDGTWQCAGTWPGGVAPTLVVAGDKVELAVGDDALKVQDTKRQPASLTCRVGGKPLGAGPLWLRLHVDGQGLAGVGTAADGSSFAIAATRGPAGAKGPNRGAEAERGRGGARGDADDDAAKADEPVPLTPLPTPLGGYGLLELPAQQEFAIVGATVWTCDGRGNLRDGAVWVKAGRIAFAGSRADLPALPEGTRIVDGTGKHVTPGIIDCHSHTGISRGVNESGQAVTAEVRVQDVVDPDDVNWYRQLAGGVTAVNQLHGSANVIGGQSNVVKLRYGVARPDEMRFEGTAPGIKFALGENPRRANGSDRNDRYPNTRMGVEGLLRDRFAAATAYAREHAAYEALAPAARAKVMPPRRDLELEALAQVLARQRRIHCHSYRQDEIFMLCQLAQEYGIEIGTFQHVLEGYKVADAIKQSAIGASSFTDWWAYKFEVYDAIPDNGAILHEVGVNVSFNSDSNEHARRLNTEAGKAVKYGGVDPATALCFVTANPAIQVGVFERTGSLTAGKDADVALWSHDPLSYGARCEATWVDGRLMFSLERDKELRDGIRRERQRLIQRAQAKGKGRRAREGDPSDTYWAAEERNVDYCCKNAEGGR